MAPEWGTLMQRTHGSSNRMPKRRCNKTDGISIVAGLTRAFQQSCRRLEEGAVQAQLSNDLHQRGSRFGQSLNTDRDLVIPPRSGVCERMAHTFHRQIEDEINLSERGFNWNALHPGNFRREHSTHGGNLVCDSCADSQCADRTYLLADHDSSAESFREGRRSRERCF